MTTAAVQLISDLHAILAAPQSDRQRANNPAPTLETIRAALEHFEHPAELQNTRTESYLINMRLIRPHVTPAQMRAAPRRTLGDYAKKYWMITPRGYFFLRDLRARKPAENGKAPCLALVLYTRAAPQFAHDYLMRIWEAHAPTETIPVRASDCPFVAGAS